MLFFLLLFEKSTNQNYFEDSFNLYEKKKLINMKNVLILKKIFLPQCKFCCMTIIIALFPKSLIGI